MHEYVNTIVEPRKCCNLFSVFSCLYQTSHDLYKLVSRIVIYLLRIEIDTMRSWHNASDHIRGNSEFSHLGRIQTHTRKREYITPVLFQLPWLPVRFRLPYKILFHTFKVLNGTAPVSLSDLIEKYIPVRMLRSESI